MKSFLAPLLGALVLVAVRASAQDRDVELLGRIHGTRPPAAYYDVRARDASAFQLERGMAVGRGLPASGARAPSLRIAPGASLVLGDHRVRGTFRFPLLLGLFADSPPVPFTPAQIQGYFFDGPNPTGTITEFYREMSRGLVELRGEVTAWGRSSLTRLAVTGGTSGLGGQARVGEFIMELLSRLPPMDWGRYDNDGPDGRPNSGDDDGYVDVLAVIHPTSGAECGGEARSDRIWSHKWTLRSAVGQVYVTQSRTPSGDHIRIDDYAIQPVYDCDGQTLNEIGVFAHELGHGFGLPDLYADEHAGTGRWDLMGSGSWGCSSRYQPERPCHMSAWSKAMLGWLPVDWLPFGGGWRTVALDPVEAGGRALAIPSGDGSGEYFLVENRQRIGFDGEIPEAGLLVWHIDPWVVDGQLATNSVNDVGSRMGVWLVQADGKNELGVGFDDGGNRGDAGDPFTGEVGRDAFHAGTTPASFTNDKPAAEQSARGVPPGGASGATITDITRSGNRIGFRVLSRYQTLHVRSVGEVAPGLVTVDGASVGEEIRSAPFQRHTIEAAAGAPLAEGVRRGFSGWQDAPGETRVREWTTGLEDAELVAVYGGPREVRFRAILEAAGTSVPPGAITTVPASPDLWFDEGTEVAFEARPRTGFEFRSWSGALHGAANPQLLLMDQPKDATATFAMVFGLDSSARVELPALVHRTITLAAKNANLPVTWIHRSGALPEGLTLDRGGVLAGEALRSGSFPIELTVRDAIGLEASGTITVTVSAPVLGTRDLASAFLLAGDPLTPTQHRYLDLGGNANGSYDLGDFRAYVLANPDAPTVTPPAGEAPQVVPLVDFGTPGTP